MKAELKMNSKSGDIMAPTPTVFNLHFLLKRHGNTCRCHPTLLNMLNKKLGIRLVETAGEPLSD